MSENIPHSLGGFRGAFESEHGRKPTEQEIWNAAIRSWRDITRQKSDSVKELEEVIADLLMYAGDNGYSHIDYADTMRHAAALLQSPTLPDHIPDAGRMVAALPVGELTDEQAIKLYREAQDQGITGVHPGIYIARAILAAASSQPVREPAAVQAEQKLSTIADIWIDDENALSLIRDMVAHEDGDLMPIRLLLGDGHSGHGLYIASADYPEEGAHLIAETPPLAAAPEVKP